MELPIGKRPKHIKFDEVTWLQEFKRDNIEGKQIRFPSFLPITDLIPPI